MFEKRNENLLSSPTSELKPFKYHSTGVYISDQSWYPPSQKRDLSVLQTELEKKKTKRRQQKQNQQTRKV